eukprot:7692396-Alexandrium_andersonii.AAC.1
MSASLVGSEMCIRDRDWREALAERATTAAPSHGSLVCHPLSESTTRGAVSYTHLTLPTICSV